MALWVIFLFSTFLFSPNFLTDTCIAFVIKEKEGKKERQERKQGRKRRGNYNGGAVVELVFPELILEVPHSDLMCMSCGKTLMLFPKTSSSWLNEPFYQPFRRQVQKEILSSSSVSVVLVLNTGQKGRGKMCLVSQV